jgi:hypothetical protein
MTDVRSGSARPVERGVAARGIATVWVAADSRETAVQRGRDVINNRHYSRTGNLTVFREENTHVTSDESIDRHEGMAAAYIAARTRALQESNGLYEIWFPPASN